MQVIRAIDVERIAAELTTDGYTVIRGVISPQRLTQFGSSLVEEFDRAKSAGELFAGGGSLTGHLNCYPGREARFIYDELQEKGIVDVVRAVDPTLTERIRATLNLNLPNSVAQHYHMDGVFTDAFIICNVAVVDTDLHNGAIDVLPGTNREFYPFWRYALQRKYRSTTRVPLDQGDVLLRLSTLWHRGMPNRSDRPRPLMSVTFGEQGAPDGDPFDQNDGKIAFFPNWFSPTRGGMLRERTFIALPWTLSAARFAKSLRGNRGYSSW
jgi:ectoine hydroxylase-related dioxygenase (phytanoyl-CoA dioxygenase family)